MVQNFLKEVKEIKFTDIASYMFDIQKVLEKYLNSDVISEGDKALVKTYAEGYIEGFLSKYTQCTENMEKLKKLQKIEENEVVEGSVSLKKFNFLNRDKNFSKEEIIDQNIELLKRLRSNLATLEKEINKDKSKDKDKKIKELEEELARMKSIYRELNKKYSDLILQIELKDIKKYIKL